jgi:hypothetical protein
LPGRYGRRSRTTVTISTRRHAPKAALVSIIPILGTFDLLAHRRLLEIPMTIPLPQHEAGALRYRLVRIE